MSELLTPEALQNPSKKRSHVGATSDRRVVKSLVAEIAEIANDTKLLAPEPPPPKKGGRVAVSPRKGSQSTACQINVQSLP